MSREKSKIDEGRSSTNFDTHSSNLKKEEISSPFDSGTGMSMSDLGSDLDLQSDKSTQFSTELTKIEESFTKVCSSTTLDSGCNLDSGYDVKDECESETHLESIQEVQQPTIRLASRNLDILDYCDEDGDTPLHLAVIQPDCDIAFHMIAHCPFFLNVLNNLYQSALHLAVLAEQPRLIRRLVIAGALLDLQDHAGNTPLHLACSRGSYECLRAMIVPAISAEIEQCGLQYVPKNGLYRFRPEVTLIRNYEGQTCVHLAVLGGHKVLECLIKCGADVNVQDGKSGQTALHMGIQMQQIAIVNLLLNQSKLNLKNYALRTPLDLAKKIAYYKPNDATATALVNALTKEIKRRTGEHLGGLESQGEEEYEGESSSEYDESSSEDDN